MNEPRIIPPMLLRVQIEASDPAASAWVAANAGSGKTHVLAQRVIRLLLDGVDPAKILCITFTKAAAANMANRVFDALAKWTRSTTTASTRRSATISNVRPTATRARAGPAAVRLRAGDAGRPQGADHPRLLHPAAAAVPVRGERRRTFHRARRGRRGAAARPAPHGRDAGRGAQSPMARSAARSPSRSRRSPTRPSRRRLPRRSASATW